MMKNKIYFILVLILANTSCKKKNSIELKLLDFLDNNCKSECIVDLNSVTEFDWDSLYYFDLTVSVEEIDSVIGNANYNFVDIGDRFLFFKNNKVAYYEEVFPEFEKQERSFEIVLKDSAHYIKLKPNRSKFNVKKEFIDAKSYVYRLIPL